MRFQKGHVPWTKGKHLSEETKRKIAQTKLGDKNSSKRLDVKKKISIGVIRAHKEGKCHGRKPGFTSHRKGISIEEEYGIEKANQIKQKLKKFGEEMGKLNGGKKRSEKTRKKMSEARKRLYREHPEILRKMSNTRKKLYKEGKIRLSSSCFQKGETHPSWQGGKSFEPYTLDFNKKFKQAIKERDYFCCQLCNLWEGDLNQLKRYLTIHHIDYIKINSFPQNCITLCNKCHSLTTKNREHWKKFFQSLLNELHQYEYTEDQKIILNFFEEDSTVGTGNCARPNKASTSSSQNKKRGNYYDKKD